MSSTRCQNIERGTGIGVGVGGVSKWFSMFSGQSVRNLEEGEMGFCLGL